MNVYRLTFIDLHLFGFFFPLFHLADRPETADKSYYVVLPPSWASEHWKYAIWLADHKQQVLGDIILINHLNTTPITKACTGLLEPACYQTCSRSFKPGLSQCPPFQVTSGNALSGSFSVCAAVSAGELPLSISTGWGDWTSIFLVLKHLC